MTIFSFIQKEEESQIVSVITSCACRRNPFHCKQPTLFVRSTVEVDPFHFTEKLESWAISKRERLSCPHQPIKNGTCRVMTFQKRKKVESLALETMEPSPDTLIKMSLTTPPTCGTCVGAEQFSHFTLGQFLDAL